MSDEPIPINESMEQVRRNLKGGARSTTGEGDELTDVDIRAMKAKGLAGMTQLRWEREIPGRFCWATPGDFPSTIAAQLLAWAESTGPTNLVVLGPWGTGKTHAAVAAIRHAFFERHLQVKFSPIGELLDSLRPGEDDRLVMADLMEVDRLIIDDLGTEKKSEWTAERIDMVVNRRWLEERPTIVTSNLAGPELESHVGGHCYSRLVGGALAIALTGDDRRR